MNWTSWRNNPLKLMTSLNTIEHFRGSSKVSIENNAGGVAILLGFVPASWTEATFHSKMQM